MGLVQVAVQRDAPARHGAAQRTQQVTAPGGLRVVMVVANDVTRDSRVLREAGALASAGHHVTVLGIMTARTTAPETELRHGFVIRRLPFRARPPGWWVPPDFYSRIKYRANRQYRIHRARFVGKVRSGRRSLRLWNAARRKRTGALISDWRLGSRDRRPGMALIRTTPRIAASGRDAVLRVRNRMVYLARRARRTPVWRWPAKAMKLTTHRTRVYEGHERHRSLADPGMDQLGWSISLRLASGMAIRALRRSSKRTLHAVVSGSVRVVRPLGNGLRAWAGIATLLAWGSVYLVANRASRGAVEWMTGWRWRWFGWARFVLAHAPDADVWHGHDMTSLPAIVALKRERGGIAIYDSHEVYLESARHAEQPAWAKVSLSRLERRLAAEVDEVITVNRSVAEVLVDRLGRSRIQVLYNCPARPSPRHGESRMRDALGLSDRAPLLLYHGSLAPHRGVEELLVAIQRPELAEAHLAFLGFGSLLPWLKDEVNEPRYGRRVHVVDAVDPDELPEWLAGVDVAVAPIQATTLNHRLSSPNKVFEAISAGTPVAGSDFPEFRHVVMDPRFGPLGELFDPARPDDIAAAVRRILDLPADLRLALRDRCLRASKERWNWETESTALTKLYERLAGFDVSGVEARVA